MANHEVLSKRALERLKEKYPEDYAALVRDLAEPAAPTPAPERAMISETISVSFSELDSYPALHASNLLQTGDLCGPYRILRLIGEGGMAAVYLAERSDDLQLQVALKVLGVWTPKRNDLFRQECRFLAELQHPGIARLYDAGIHTQGQPWMAMEYVKGTALDNYLAWAKPDLETRLAIFTRLGDALSHAHHQMIIHRDLKPSNILVREDGQPVLLDFGIAATLDPGTGEQTGLTLVNERIMTPQYASPEQINGLRLSAASDVYSLGLILYEMVSGQRAYSLEGQCISEVIRIVNSQPIVKPSEARGEKDQRRGPFAARLRGDMDTIILKALERDPLRRYVSVEAMVADVRAFLKGLPIHARPASGLYRFKKFVRRHPWPTLTATMLIVGFIGFLAYARYQNQRVKAERDSAHQDQRRAEAVTEFMVGLFERVDPNVTKGKDLRAIELLEGGMAQIETDLDEEPAVKTALLQTMGRVYHSLGEYRNAATLFEQALALDHTDATRQTELRRSLISALIKAGAYSEAMRELDLAENWFRNKGLPLPSMLLKLRGDTCVETGQFVAAAAAFDQVWARAGLTESETTDLKFAQARLYEMWGFYDRSLDYYRQVVEAKQNRFGRLHSETADSLIALANVYGNIGEYQKGEDVFAEAAAILTTLYDKKHLRYAQLLQSRAYNLFRMDRNEESEQMFAEAMAIFEGFGDPNHPEYAMCINKQGILFRDQGNHQAAEKAFRRALSMFSDSSGESHPHTLMAQYNLSLSLRSLGQNETSEALLHDGVEKAGRLLGDQHPLFATYLYSMAVNHYRHGDLRESVATARRVLDIRRRGLGRNHPRTINTTAFVARRLHEDGRLDEALSLMGEAIAMMKQNTDTDPKNLVRSQRRYHMFLAEMGRHKEAIRGQQALLQRIEREFPKNFDIMYAQWSAMAVIYKDARLYAEAEAAYAKVEALVLAKRGRTTDSVSRLVAGRALCLRRSGQWDRAAEMYRADLEYREKKYGRVSENYAHMLYYYALMYCEQGDTATAERLWREVRETRVAVGIPEIEQAALRMNLISVMMANGKEKEAFPLIPAVMADATQHYGKDTPLFGEWLYYRALRLVELGFHKHAKPFVERSLEVLQQLEPVPAFRLAPALGIAALVAADEGDADSAHRYLNQAEATLVEAFGRGDHVFWDDLAKTRADVDTLLKTKKEVL